MNQIIIEGGTRLEGDITIQGSKNAVLPILAACVLHKGTTILHHCPQIQDVYDMITIMEALGGKACFTGNTLFLDTSEISAVRVPQEASRIRSSVLFLGSLLGRTGEAVIPYPGGCRIGSRPVDLHLAAMERLGAGLSGQEAMLKAGCTGLVGTDITLRFPSVGATENTILAAVRAKGTTRIIHAAREPEIRILCDFLNGKGARISGAGTDTMVIQGVERLSDSEFSIPADRIVAGTYLLAAAVTGGRVCIRDFPFDQTEAVLKAVGGMGVSLRRSGRDLEAAAEKKLKGTAVETAPYPGFPTDLQSQILVAMAVAGGTSRIRENLFENRFHIVRQLNRMGARIDVDGCEAVIQGVDRLHGTLLEARELRGGAALVLAGLAAEGTTTITNGYFIHRGYENICRDLYTLGGRIREQ